MFQLTMINTNHTHQQMYVHHIMIRNQQLRRNTIHYTVIIPKIVSIETKNISKDFKDILMIFTNF
ncbi:MAG: hypothetical protein EBQ89_06640 [Alphaproteobacteria bacterium]|nr:hypothetical protein [Alphaproteobacteria bacterium]